MSSPEHGLRRRSATSLGVNEAIRDTIPTEEISMVLDNLGTPVSSLNLALSDGTLISAAEGEVLIALKPERRCSTPEYVRRLRRELAARFPELVFFFQAPDIATQVLNFGISAPIDIQIVGPLGNQAENLRIAQAISREVAAIPGAVDVRLHQVVNVPELRVDVDRTLAAQLGLSQRDVANDMLMSLSGSGQTAPNFWLDPVRGVQYSITVQTPQYRIDSVNTLRNTPITAAGLNEPQLLGNVSRVSHSTGPANVTHYNVARTLDVLAGVQDADLGSVSRGVDEILARFQPQLPRGSTVVVRGQVQSMNNSFSGLTYGLIFAVLLVYLLMVVNFQSWVDPLIILMALPGALSGILWSLFATGTTISVPSLMGAIMSIGVATANSILVITFANDQRRLGMNASQAALAAGMTRLRPVLMTALAMIMGMLPMSLGLSEGGEQNAPLGRAVIGGLIMADLRDALLRAGGVQCPASSAAQAACRRTQRGTAMIETQANNESAASRSSSRVATRRGHSSDGEWRERFLRLCGDLETGPRASDPAVPGGCGGARRLVPDRMAAPN